MRLVAISFAVGVSLLVTSCDLLSADDDGESSSNTYFRATLNGETTWSGRPNAAFSKQGSFNWLSIHADSTYAPGYREVLSFSVPFRGGGTYSLARTEHDINPTYVRTSGASFYESIGDVSVASYHPTGDTSANRLKITSYDANEGIITGTFHTTVIDSTHRRVSEPGEPLRYQPDTLRFTEGTFRVKVRDLRE